MKMPLSMNEVETPKCIKRVSQNQWEIMIEYLSTHLTLARGTHHTGKSREKLQREWKHLADLLNSDKTGGASKSPQEWTTYFNNYKSKLKAKVQALTSDVAQSDCLQLLRDKLSELELRVLNLLGDGFVQGKKSVGLNLFNTKLKTCGDNEFLEGGDKACSNDESDTSGSDTPSRDSTHKVEENTQSVTVPQTDSSKEPRTLRPRHCNSKRVTAEQKDLLCRFFEEHPNVIQRHKKNPRESELIQEKWKTITQHLNTLGPPKDMVTWQKYLRNLKQSLKRKRVTWKQKSDGSGPVICNAGAFGATALRMLQVLTKGRLDSKGQYSSDEEMCFEDCQDDEPTVEPSSVFPISDDILPTSLIQKDSEASSDEFYAFGQNIAFQLRRLPLATALETQEMLLSVMRNQRLKVVLDGK